MAEMTNEEFNKKMDEHRKKMKSGAKRREFEMQYGSEALKKIIRGRENDARRC